MARDGSPERSGSSHEGTPDAATPPGAPDEEAPSSLLPTNQFKVLNPEKAMERLSSVPPSRPPPPAERTDTPDASARPDVPARAARSPAATRKGASWVAQPWVMLSAGAVFAFAVALSLYKLLQ